MDANQPVIRVEATGDQAFAMSCSNEVWRSSAYTPSGSDPAADSWRGVNTGWTETADVVPSFVDRIVSYHRNASSQFQTILAGENLSGQWANFADPYTNRTFGLTIKGTPNFSVANSQQIQSVSGTNATVSIYAYTAQTPTAAAWQTQMGNIVSQVDATDIETARTNHYNWWDGFWNRSWIFISGDVNATNVTRGYLQQRFLEACQGRGYYPMKFNGGTVVFDYNGLNADYRRWGPGMWAQNTRHCYWPLLASGDWDLMHPWFNQYTNMLPIQMAAVSKYFGHGGAFFPETFNMFGLFLLTDWGGNSSATNAASGWMEWHYQGGLEALAMMLTYYDYTQDSAFATNVIVPFGTQVVRFFNQHWPLVNGKLFFYPANALEMYWGCTNSADYICGLRGDIPRLMALSTNFTTPALLNEWSNCYAVLPPIPMDNTGSYVRGAQTYGQQHNVENPECYSIFPYHLYGIGLSNFNIAITTFTNRVIPYNKNCWSQDVIQEPLVGLTGTAQADVISNFGQTDSQCRFQAFWTSHNDYLPDLDNGGAAMTGLQYMLMQCPGSQIRILPSWPLTWNVDFKLCGPSNTTVRVKYQAGSVTELDATPAFRTNDVIYPPPPSAPPSAPTALTAKAGDTQISLTWAGDGTAAGYNVKRGLVSGGPYTNVAANVRSTSYLDTGLSDGTNYYYVVAGTNSFGESAYSAEVSAMPTCSFASASSDNPPNEAAAMAFDGNTNTKWFNASGGSVGWLLYKYCQPVIVVSYALTSANDVPGRDPKDWQFQGSLDGNNWTTLDTQSNQAFASRFQTIQYSMANTNGYTYHRLNITANNGDATGLQLAEMAFTLTPTAPPSIPTGLTAVANGTQVTLSWQPAANAVTYNLKRALTSGGSYANLVTGLTATGYVDSGLTSGTTYYYVVSAVNNLGESANSFEVSATAVTPPTHIEAENYTSQSGTTNENCSDIGGTLDVGYINSGDWCIYNGVNFGARTLSLSARVASAGSGGNIEVRLGATNGTLVGVINVPVTGGWQIWTNTSTALANVSGVQNLALRFVGPSGFLFNVNWLEFTPVSTVPPRLAWQRGGGNPQFTWPSDHIGWVLQAQTNALGSGLGTNWFNVSASGGTNFMIIPMNPANGSVFYRLFYPF